MGDEGPSAVFAARPGPEVDLPERSLLCPVLVERERELEVLAAAVDRLPGQGGVVVLAGGRPGWARPGWCAS